MNVTVTHQVSREFDNVTHDKRLRRAPLLILTNRPAGQVATCKYRSMSTTQPGEGVQDRRTKALEEYRKKLVEHRELDANLKKRTSPLVCVVCHIIIQILV